MITAKQLRQAAKLIDHDGWVKFGRFRDGGYCPLGAIARIMYGDVWRIGGPVTELDQFDLQAITHNDAPDCTKDAAVMFLLMCAEAREHGDL